MVVDAQGRLIRWPTEAAPAPLALAAAPTGRPAVVRGAAPETPAAPRPSAPPRLPAPEQLGVGLSPAPARLPSPEALGIGAPR
jgi:hypothetical protein